MADEVFEQLQEIVDRIGDRLFGKYEELLDEEKTFRLVWSIVGDVYNGGFFQFLGNTDSSIVDAPRAFLAIGATGKARAITSVLKLCGTSVDWTVQKSKDALVGRLSEPAIEVLDNRFIHESENIDPLLLAYVTRHRSIFYPEAKNAR